jgi:hypothetical protein
MKTDFHSSTEGDDLTFTEDDNSSCENNFSSFLDELCGGQKNENEFMNYQNHEQNLHPNYLSQDKYCVSSTSFYGRRADRQVP